MCRNHPLHLKSMSKIRRKEPTLGSGDEFDIKAKVLSLHSTIKNRKIVARARADRVIFDRIYRYVTTSSSDSDLLAKLLLDFPAFSAMFLESKGIPIYLAPWQQEVSDILDRTNRVVCYAARRMGKSTLFASKITHLVCSVPNTVIQVFAPSEQQDVCYREVRNHFSKNPFLFEKFIRGNTFNTERIELSNGSLVQNFTIDIQKEGRLLRGSGGTIFVDEISLIPKRTLTSVIFPMVSDAYKDNRLWMIGTPSLEMNAELDTMTERWKADPSWAVVMGAQSDWHRAIREGCIDATKTIETMREMSPDEITMEYEADFPRQQGRFFPAYTLGKCIPDEPRWRLLEDHELRRNPSTMYVMAVDWARVLDRTEILVGELFEGRLKYVYWKRLDPQKDDMNYNTQVALVQDIFHRMGVQLFIADFTSHQDTLIPLLTAGSKGIPEYLFWKNPKEEIGYRASDDSNHNMWQNHRRLMMGGRILSPNDISHQLTATFISEWKRQHNSLNIKKTTGAKMLLRLEEPRGGHKDLAVASAMLSLASEQIIHPPWLGMAGFGGGHDVDFDEVGGASTRRSEVDRERKRLDDGEDSDGGPV